MYCEESKDLTPFEEELQAEIRAKGKEVHQLRNDLQVAEIERKILQRKCTHRVIDNPSSTGAKYCTVCGAIVGINKRM